MALLQVNSRNITRIVAIENLYVGDVIGRRRRRLHELHTGSGALFQWMQRPEANITDFVITGTSSQADTGVKLLQDAYHAAVNIREWRGTLPCPSIRKGEACLFGERCQYQH